MTLEKQIEHHAALAELEAQQAEICEQLIKLRGQVVGNELYGETMENSKKQAAYHKQYAEWLTELKELREKMG